jgi:hypothetical protein
MNIRVTGDYHAVASAALEARRLRLKYSIDGENLVVQTDDKTHADFIDYLRRCDLTWDEVAEGNGVET